MPFRDSVEGYLTAIGSAALAVFGVCSYIYSRIHKIRLARIRAEAEAAMASDADADWRASYREEAKRLKEVAAAERAEWLAELDRRDKQCRADMDARDARCREEMELLRKSYRREIERLERRVEILVERIYPVGHAHRSGANIDESRNEDASGNGPVPPGHH